MSDRLFSDQEADIRHLFYTAQELKCKKKIALYRPVITVYEFIYDFVFNNCYISLTYIYCLFFKLQ